MSESLEKIPLNRIQEELLTFFIPKVYKDGWGVGPPHDLGRLGLTLSSFTLLEELACCFPLGGMVVMS